MTTVKETHPYNLRGIIPDETRMLIVGTAPPPRFSNPACGGMRRCDFDFFYGSKDNYMWEFLENIAEEIEQKKLFAKDASSVQCRGIACAFLRRHKLWMHDVLQTYQRKPGKECSASDTDIRPPTVADCTDFRSALSTLVYLDAIAFTSEKAAEWTFKLGGLGLDRYREVLSKWRMSNKELPLEEYILQKYQRPFLQTCLGQRDIKFYILPSPTGRSPKKGLSIKEKQKIYKFVLFK